MARPTHTEDDLSMLTEAEREGLLDTDLVDEGENEEIDDSQVATDAAAANALEVQGKRDLAIEAGDDDAAKAELAARRQAEADAQTAKQEAAAALAAKPADTAAAAAEAAKVAAPAAAAAEATGAAPIFPQYVAPAGAKEKLDDIETKLAEIDRKFDEGELTASERRAQLRPLEDDKSQLKEALNRAQMSKDTMDTHWRDVSVPAFLSKHTEYDAVKNPALYKALDQRVRELQVAAAAEGKHRDPAILEKAHKSLQDDARALLGVKETAKTPAVPDPKARRREIPPSLAHVPAADISDADDGSEFAWLDRLSDTNPEAFQQSLAKMKDDERERYLAQ